MIQQAVCTTGQVTPIPAHYFNGGKQYEITCKDRYYNPNVYRYCKNAIWALWPCHEKIPG